MGAYDWIKFTKTDKKNSLCKTHPPKKFDKDNNYFKALSQIEKLEDEIKKLEKEKFDKVIKSDQKVVVISTAHGLKFSEFKIRYHENKLEDVKPEFKNLPVELPPDYDSVKRAIFNKLEDLED